MAVLFVAFFSASFSAAASSLSRLDLISDDVRSFVAKAEIQNKISELNRSANKRAPSAKRAPAADEDFSEFEDEFASATGKPRPKVYDPFQGYNRFMFGFNDKLYENVLKPMIKGYNWLLPEGVRVALAKFFHNLLFPLRFVNNVLQLKIGGATTEVGRFFVNTTLGIGGIFDPADHYFGWLPHNEDFGQTLAFYGVGEGFPIVLPVLGQSNLRDGIGILPTYLFHPVYHVNTTRNYELYLAEQSWEYFNFASLHYQEYDAIRKDALDPYTFVRDAYSQNRQKQILE